ncbi:MAG: transcription termination/antitermination factor NusG [Thermoleophilia bacterium]|nr:transcription termination/antitermination factor NusG [Thermoleophilia bacterium]
MYNWYVINTYSGHEKKVEANLMQRFKSAPEDVRFALRDVVVPTEMVTETDKDGKKVTKEQRTLPGYLLVHMNMDNKNARLLVRDTPGVTNFVGPQGEPVPLSRAELAKLVSSAAPEQPTTQAPVEEKAKPEILFELGEIVKVMSGPLSDFDGEITEINVEQQKLKVLVSIFERQVPVELPYDQVQKV